MIISCTRESSGTVPAPSFISFNPVSVDDWARAIEFPTGSREKSTLIDPTTGDHSIFKYPKDKREHQLWSELLASYIAGDLLGWEVQHTGIACRGGRLGNLLAYIYEPGHKGNSKETLIEGEKLLTQIDPDFDVVKGTRHTLPLLLRVCDELLVPEYNLAKEKFLDFWARAFALDTLISNTDRHAENWAIITGSGGTRMAALYDNGSSLGCGLDQKGLDRAFDKNGTIRPDHLNKQMKAGRHHVRAKAPSKHGSTFEEVCLAFLEIYPDGKQWFEAAEGVDIEAVCRQMDSIRNQSGVKEPYFLSVRRQQHVHAMLQIGLERIRSVLHRD